MPTQTPQTPPVQDQMLNPSLLDPVNSSSWTLLWFYYLLLQFLLSDAPTYL